MTHKYVFNLSSLISNVVSTYIYLYNPQKYKIFRDFERKVLTRDSENKKFENHCSRKSLEKNNGKRSVDQ